jgi:hypothetical protein
MAGDAGEIVANVAQPGRARRGDRIERRRLGF